MQHQNKKHNQFLANRKTAFQFVFFLSALIGLFIFSINITQAEGNDSYTKLLLHGDGTGNSFTDSSSSNKTITAYGNATQSSTQSKFGGKSAYFDGNGDYLSVSDSDDWDFGSGDFTVDFWTKTSTFFNYYIFSRSTGDYADFALQAYTGGELRFLVDNGSDNGYVVISATSGAGLSDGAYHHIAVVRNSGTTNIYVDGVSKLTIATAYNVTFSSVLNIGGEPLYSIDFAGYIDEFRISKGIARWTSDFTPPTSAYSSIDPKTVIDPTPKDIEADIIAEYLSVTGTNSAATAAKINASYTLQSNNSKITIPSGTTITPTQGGTMNITNLTANDISQEIQQENFNSKGAIEVGIPNQGLSFNQDVTITLNVNSSYNGETLKVYSRLNNEEDWTYETTCLVADSKCTFTTTHATEYTANYEVSNSNTPTDINLSLDSTISLTCTDSVTMGTITGTGQSSLATNEALCTVGTNNSTGYALYWQASTAYLENGTGDQITAYSPITPDTPENWEVSATESEWGGKLKSGSTTYNSSTWGDDDTYSNGNWLNINTSSHQIITRTTETTQAGDEETLLFGAEIGSNKFQPTGTYDVDVTVTATTL